MICLMIKCSKTVHNKTMQMYYLIQLLFIKITEITQNISINQNQNKIIQLVLCLLVCLLIVTTKQQKHKLIFVDFW